MSSSNSKNVVVTVTDKIKNLTFVAPPSHYLHPEDERRMEAVLLVNKDMGVIVNRLLFLLSELSKWTTYVGDQKRVPCICSLKKIVDMKSRLLNQVPQDMENLLKYSDQLDVLIVDAPDHIQRRASVLQNTLDQNE